MDGGRAKFARMWHTAGRARRETAAMAPADPVQAQVDAYNARDLERFLASYAPAAEIFSDAAAEPDFRGVAAIRARYARLFEAEPDLHCEIRGRLRAGAWTVDEELVTRSDGPIHCLVAYRVADGLIDRVLFLDTPAPAAGAA
jgi:hypothetical protein